ncbi:MAG: radical SAM protein, partial [Pseudomonadota bacterium]
VNDWLKGETIYPIYLEMSPSGTCNHRCTFCALDYMKYQKRYLDTQVLKERLQEMGDLGIKSIMYAGEGEPLLHPDIANIINHTKTSGIDVALTTNGVLLNKTLAEEILGNVEWIKVSIAAATDETYSKIHRTKPSDFAIVLENMAYSARLRQAKGYKCTLGMQILLIPENEHEVCLLAETAKGIGMDYLVVKPYSQHPKSKTQKYKEIEYSKYLHLGEKLERIETENFQVIFRTRTMMKWDQGLRPYERCLALPFWSYIDAGGNVWGCSIYLGDERFCFGNLHEKTFQEIWEGKKRLDFLKKFEESFDIGKCRINCRMDEINRYLWELINPSTHVNFI